MVGGSVGRRRRQVAQFQVGDAVYLRPLAHRWGRESFTVMEVVLRGGWPHYRLRAPDQSTWLACQLELSTTRLWDGRSSSAPRRKRRRLRSVAPAAAVAVAPSGAKSHVPSSGRLLVA